MSSKQDFVIITDYSTFDTALLQFNVTKNNRGGSVAWIKYNGKKLYIKTPPDMYCPFGMSVFKNNYDEKLSLNVSFKGYDIAPPDSNEKMKFLELLQKIDSLICSIPETDPSWFGEIKSQELLSTTHNTLVKSDANGRYAPTFKMNFVNYGGTNDSILYSPDRKTVLPLTPENIQKGCVCTAVFMLQSVWFMGPKFGIAPKIQQIRCVPYEDHDPDKALGEAKTTLGSEYAFIDSDEE